MSGNFCTLIPYLSLHSIPGGLLLMMQSPYPRVIWGNTANPVQSLSQCGWDWIPTPWAHSLLLVIGSWYPLSASFPHRGTLNSKPYTVSICTCTQGSKNLHIKPSLNIWFSVHIYVALGFEPMSFIFYISFHHVQNKNYNGYLDQKYMVMCTYFTIFLFLYAERKCYICRMHILLSVIMLPRRTLF